MLADTQNTQDTQAAPAETTPTDPRRRYLCRHVFADGHRCGSPALRQRNFCFYHHAGRRPAPGPGKFRYLDATEPFTLPLVEDRVSALLAASLILSRIASNDLDHARAGRLIADLRVIATLLPREPRPTAAAADAAAAKQSAAATQPPVEDLILDEAHGLIAPITEPPEPNPADPLQNCHPERSSASTPNAVEEPVLSLSKEPAVASPTATTPRTSPRAPKRVYTDEEKDFLKCTTSSTHYAPVNRPRPESITDDDIIAAINANRRRCSLGPIDTEPNWNKATLSALASRYPEASASGLSPAAQEEGALAPGVSSSATLPTLQAACEPKHVRSPRLTTVETSHRGYVSPGGGIPVNLATHSRQLATSNRSEE